MSIQALVAHNQTKKRTDVVAILNGLSGGFQAGNFRPEKVISNGHACTFSSVLWHFGVERERVWLF